MARTIADAALEKQASDVVILDLRELDAVTDCFVVCTGSVDQQVRAIADNIERQVKAVTGDRLLHREGKDTLNWVILDYVNVVAHVFKPSFREFYRLENLWSDAEVITVEDSTSKATGKAPVRRAPRASAEGGELKQTATRRSPVKKAPAKRAAAKKAGTSGRKTSSPRRTKKQS